MPSLSGKVALITGGASGIGRAMVEHFIAQGARVMTCGRRQKPDDLPQGVVWQTADVARPEQVAALVATLRQTPGRLDVLVNNAGVQLEKTVLETSDAEYDWLMGINAKGTFLCCREAIPLMIENGGGTIINIGSIAGNIADIGLALYNGSKAFVHGLSRSIATDHGKQGIRCNAVCPGWIMTDMADTAFAVAQDPAAAQADALLRHATQRFGQPADVARLAAWLASDDAAFVTGQEFVVDGGLSAASPLNPTLF